MSSSSTYPIWLHVLRFIIPRGQIDPDYAHSVSGILAGVVPASDALSLKTISGTLEQAAISIDFSSIVRILRGPRHLAEVGIDTVHTGFEVACNTVRYPLGFPKWGCELATSAAELAGQVARDVSKPAKEKATAVNLLVD